VHRALNRAGQLASRRLITAKPTRQGQQGGTGVNIRSKKLFDGIGGGRIGEDDKLREPMLDSRDATSYQDTCINMTAFHLQQRTWAQARFQ
jgi:hypothetical protein